MDLPRPHRIPRARELRSRSRFLGDGGAPVRRGGNIINDLRFTDVTNLTEEERASLEEAQRDAKKLRDEVRRWISGEDRPSDGQFTKTVL